MQTAQNIPKPQSNTNNQNVAQNGQTAQNIPKPQSNLNNQNINNYKVTGINVHNHFKDYSKRYLVKHNHIYFYCDYCNNDFC